MLPFHLIQLLTGAFGQFLTKLWLNERLSVCMRAIEHHVLFRYSITKKNYRRQEIVTDSVTKHGHSKAANKGFVGMLRQHLTTIPRK